ncbi:myo-inositol-1(or 4)-monophosphatase [Pullulanibacillus pueri]|uniref:Inositol-1-monophosphatase n=1 Tax=Pullulanibacillus pueri TaxID=1437324 RepID=A0A8J2ZST9_9BACL|nr:inositol monophosphatase family protein [Pullulanibacillus pueri]MBM7680085.1 myo-inositol-1(or 4)-monophosphatase [Pullulanibacillus pueri]GGH74295.1 inositol-1-monophosphatase [Pullulanibacillus pueri]
MAEALDWGQVRDQVIEWVQEAGDILKKAVNGHLNVESKSSPDDLVTNMDKQTEQYFIDKVRSHFPGHRIVSEEGFGDEVQTTEGILWFIDPIDGTMNFVHQKRHFAISIGIYEEGVGKVAVIYDVIAGDIYHCVKGQGAFINKEKMRPLEDGELKTSVVAINGTWLSKNRRINPEIVRSIAEHTRGTRSYGSAAIELAYIANGILDGYLSMRLAPWDIGAGLILIDEVGGRVSQVDGSPLELLKQNSILIGKKGVHQEMLQYIQSGIAEGKYVEKK